VKITPDPRFGLPVGAERDHVHDGGADAFEGVHNLRE
jgi:hypothetical protein